MLSLRDVGPRLCDGLTRREMLRVGGLASLGLSWPELLRAKEAQAKPPKGKAKACIILFLMGGPPQHSTWDPKPLAPVEVRGEFKPIATSVPGLQISELLPKLSRQADKLCLLRAVSTTDNAHSSSGYYMMTGVPHQPMNFENANPGAPNDWPHIGAIVRRLRGDKQLPASVRLPHRIFNTDGSVWPGQQSGFLGRAAEPWLFHCEPGSPHFKIPEFTLNADVAAERLADRQGLLQRLDRSFAQAEGNQYDRVTRQAFDLLRSAKARSAFDLSREPDGVRDRYGRGQFGQSVLLARRLVEAGVSLVQVNWFRGPDEPSDAPCWDSHAREGKRLKEVLCPTLDQAMSALLDDLTQRGMLGETLVAAMSEFGRSPRLNGGAGRDHWGSVFSVALAGGGVRGGQVHGASDAYAAQPRDGRVMPQDLTATLLDCLGYEPDTEMRDNLGRPLPISRGHVVRSILS